jgi:hypothetical protein
MRYFQLYSRERIHESLGYRTPHKVYFGGNNNYDEGDARRLIYQYNPFFCLDNGEGYIVCV